MTLTAAPATRTAPAEPTTPILPSQAIRLGCLIAPVQGEGSFFPAPGEACALGAMALGFGYDGRLDDEPYSFVDARLPRNRIRVPGWSEPLSYSDAIYVLNDGRRWSRERIADWLEGLGL